MDFIFALGLQMLENREPRIKQGGRKQSRMKLEIDDLRNV